jgi:hypothetical protein
MPQEQRERLEKALQTPGEHVLLNGITLYRGMETGKAARVKSNARIEGSALQSASLDKGVADEFANLGIGGDHSTIFEYKLSGSVPAVPVKTSGQSEFILPKADDIVGYYVSKRVEGRTTIHTIAVTGYYPRKGRMRRTSLSAVLSVASHNMLYAQRRLQER